MTLLQDWQGIYTSLKMPSDWPQNDATDKKKTKNN